MTYWNAGRSAAGRCLLPGFEVNGQRVARSISRLAQ